MATLSCSAAARNPDPAGNEAAFADAVQKLLADSALRQQLGGHARQFAQENFSLDRVRRALRGTLCHASGEETPKAGAPSFRAPFAGRAGSPSRRARQGNSRETPVALDRSAQPALRRRTIRPRPSRLLVQLAGRSRYRHQLPRRRSAAARVLRGPNAFPACARSARTHLLLALWQGLKNMDVAHIFSASYWSFLLAPAPRGLAKMKPRGAKNSDQLPQRRSPRPPATLPLRQVRSLSRRQNCCSLRLPGRRLPRIWIAGIGGAEHRRSLQFRLSRARPAAPASGLDPRLLPVLQHRYRSPGLCRNEKTISGSQARSGRQRPLERDIRKLVAD